MDIVAGVRFPLQFLMKIAFIALVFAEVQERTIFTAVTLPIFNMKLFQNLSLLVLLVLPVWASGQQAAIETALQKGNAAGLEAYLAKTIDLSIPGEDDAYPAGEAVKVLTGFFAKQVVKGYKRVHLSAPQEGRANYSIGELSTGQGTYRITLYFDAQQKISEINIQK